MNWDEHERARLAGKLFDPCGPTCPREPEEHVEFIMEVDGIAVSPVFETDRVDVMKGVASVTPGAVLKRRTVTSTPWEVVSDRD